MYIIKNNAQFNKYFTKRTKYISPLDNVLFIKKSQSFFGSRQRNGSFFIMNLPNKFSYLNVLEPWSIVHQAYRNKSNVWARILSVIDWGYLVGFLGVIGFIPHFQLTRLNVSKGDVISVRILKTNSAQRSILLTIL